MKTLKTVVHLLVFFIAFGMWWYDMMVLKNPPNLLDTALFALWGGVALWYIQLPLWKYYVRKTDEELKRLSDNQPVYKQHAEHRRRFRDSRL